MSRLISVDELKEWIKNWFDVNRNYHPYSKQNNIPIQELYDILDRIPAVQRCADCENLSKTQLLIPQPERKKGKWIETDSHEPCWYKCDQCGRLHDFLDNFCPNCGADMRGEGHE